MTDVPRASDTTEMLTLLGRIDERTKNLAQEALETRQAVGNLNTQVGTLDAKFATRRELNLMKWLLGILAALLTSGVIALVVASLNR